MHPGIKIKTEGSRGCGNRKLGGMYLVFDGPVAECGKLPIPFEICPCCGEGIRPSRAPKWLKQPEKLWNSKTCNRADRHRGCTACPMSNAFESGPALLIWVDSQHYDTPRRFVQESLAQGISRRIQSIPRQFKIGETWVLLAHEKAIEVDRPITDTSKDKKYRAGIFGMMKPQRIEIVVSGDEPDEEIEGYIKRGLTPVAIKKAAPPPPPFKQESFIGD